MPSQTRLPFAQKRHSRDAATKEKKEKMIEGLRSDYRVPAHPFAGGGANVRNGWRLAPAPRDMIFTCAVRGTVNHPRVGAYSHVRFSARDGHRCRARPLAHGLWPCRDRYNAGRSNE